MKGGAVVGAAPWVEGINEVQDHRKHTETQGSFDRWLWLRVLLASGFSDGDKVVATSVFMHTKADGADCFPSVQLLARETHRNRRTVQRSLRRLEAAGWLKVGERVSVGGRGHSNRGRRYFLALPADTETPGASAAGFGERGGRSVPKGAVVAPPEVHIEVHRKENTSAEVEEAAVVEAVFTLCRELRAQRLGKVGGPPLQLTDKRRSKIRVRLREGFTQKELQDCAHGFYADDWSERDRYLDPVYAYKDEDTVRRYVEQHRNGNRSRDAKHSGPQYLNVQEYILGRT